MPDTYDLASVKSRADQYEHKAKVLRQIHSNKLEKASAKNDRLNYTTIIASAIVAGMTFFGVKNLHNLFFSSVMSFEKLDFTFSFVTLILLVAAILQLSLRLGERAVEHLNSVRKLTDFLTDIDDIKAIKELPADQCGHMIDRMKSQYLMISNSLPSNSDKEWKKAKKTLTKKETEGRPAGAPR